MPRSLFEGEVTLHGGFAFNAASSRGLQVVDLREPVAPAIVASLPAHTGGTLHIQNDIALLVGEELTLVLDIRDPARPRLSGGWSWSAGPMGIVDGIAYLVEFHGGMQLVRMNPLLPAPAVQDSRKLTLQVPAGMSPGFYHVLALQPDGGRALLPNAVEIVGPSLRRLPLPGARRAVDCPTSSR